MTPEEQERVRAETWADIAAVLNDRAQMWQDANRRVLAEECRGMANACRTYAEGVGIPSIDSLRAKRRAAEAAVERVRALHRESGGWCENCCFGWPCQTIRALEDR